MNALLFSYRKVLATSLEGIDSPRAGGADSGWGGEGRCAAFRRAATDWEPVVRQGTAL